MDTELGKSYSRCNNIFNNYYDKIDTGGQYGHYTLSDEAISTSKSIDNNTQKGQYSSKLHQQ